MSYLEYTEPNVCIGQNLATDEAGQLLLQPHSVPRPVVDVRAAAAGDGTVYSTTALPGKLLIDRQISHRNDTPLEQQMFLRVTRASRSLITSNPNAIQFRDRWTYAVDAEPELPNPTGYFNGKSGAALDVGTNSVAEPNPGVLWYWSPTNSIDEWLDPLEPGQQIRVWYRCYVWTPDPWSDNANKNNPVHDARANWARLQLWLYPQQGELISG